ncbi:MAG: D-tyrosyl-tRNA(Tyr) deacylase [Candidatus Abyssobacteria bacterium SURF_17]|jgi:D-tyrosyl-tRNA(Tyr) deacylase|uniref:D-aminoacyl-tRNA deacylase n=1 Tax=Candidatus Abyssobacteria bacterium SURF_17 TaxID=2093361 RepID=A0A419ENC6_9BACT|nr:MAG: D-tyrosyl-tRNA(Tyr) deacylase [Candidatus Abyssubacteria bacterium SURF_17]
MRAVIQRVKRASVSVGGGIVAEIGKGLLVLVGVGKEDAEEDARYIAEKLSFLRIFEDSEGKMNLSVRDVGGSVLVVSQFTLFADCRKGRRPSFTDAGEPEQAQQLYQRVIDLLNESGLTAYGGIFQASMDVELVNDGPVTILLDSKKGF